MKKKHSLYYPDVINCILKFIIYHLNTDHKNL